MNRLFVLRGVIAIGLSLAAGTAIAQSTGSSSATPSSMPGMITNKSKEGGPSSPADKAMMAGMEKMSNSMNGAALTGNADQDFVKMMMPHHQGAIDMAQVELKYGKDPKMRRMAADIVAAQEKELREMQHWTMKHSGQ